MRTAYRRTCAVDIAEYVDRLEEFELCSSTWLCTLAQTVNVIPTL